MAKKSLAVALSLSLISAHAATADTFTYKCRLLSSGVADVPYSLYVVINEDARTMNWQADGHIKLLEASVGANTVSFRGPYTDTPSSFNRSTGALVVTDAKYRSMEYLCQFRSAPL